MCTHSEFPGPTRLEADWRSELMRAPGVDDASAEALFSARYIPTYVYRREPCVVVAVVFAAAVKSTSNKRNSFSAAATTATAVERREFSWLGLQRGRGVRAAGKEGEERVEDCLGYF